MSTNAELLIGRIKGSPEAIELVSRLAAAKQSDWDSIIDAYAAELTLAASIEEKQ